MSTEETFRSFAAVLISILLGLSPARTRGTTGAQENIPSTGTELPDMDFLAARIAEKLVKTGNKVVAVAQFHGQNTTDSWTLGLELSEQLAIALTRASGGIQVFDNARLIKALEGRKWMAIDIGNSQVFGLIAHTEGVQAAVGGKYKILGEFIELSITVTNAKNERKIAEFKVKIPATQAAETPPDNPVRDPVTQVFLAGVGGVTSPQCKYCPAPEFSPEAREKSVSKAQTVLLVTVRADGRATDVRVVRPAGYGLDESAAQAVRTWQFTAGHLGNGAPVPTRVDIEVTFERR
jgi:TonB family protein